MSAAVGLDWFTSADGTIIGKYNIQNSSQQQQNDDDTAVHHGQKNLLILILVEQPAVPCNNVRILRY